MATSQPRRDVRVIGDLCPCPPPCPVQDQFQLLQTVLNELRLPLTVDRREQPRAGDANDVTVVLLAEIGEAVSVFFEGKNRQSDGDGQVTVSDGDDQVILGDRNNQVSVSDGDGK